MKGGGDRDQLKNPGRVGTLNVGLHFFTGGKGQAGGGGGGLGEKANFIYVLSWGGGGGRAC